MERTLEEIFPIMDIEDDCIVSKMGDVTVAFEVDLPEIFTCSSSEYEAVHQSWVKAIKVLPKNTVLHKQDWFCEAKYTPEGPKPGESFLQRSSEQFFTGRRYMSHRCFVFLTRKPASRRAATSASSSLLRKSIVPDEVLSPQASQEFMDSVGQFTGILKDGGMIGLRRVPGAELSSTAKTHGLIEKYCYLLEEPGQNVIRDITFRDGIQVGGHHCEMYTLADAVDLPALCGSRITYEKYSTDKTKYSVGFAAPLGLLLPCNHIYNQYVFIEDAPATLKKLESKRLRLQSLSSYSRENAIAQEAVNDFLNEAIGEQRLPVKAHFNVLVWTDDKKELPDIKNLVSASLAQMEAMPKEETVGAAQIFWAGIPGNAGDFPSNDRFDTFAEQAACFLNVETNYRSAESGIRFGDRLTGRPLWVDLFQGPMKAGWITNRNLFCCGGSGGGKSVTLNHLVRSLYDQGAHIVMVDIGGSYKGLCDMVKGYYFTYDEKKPIRFNPFYMPHGETMDPEKKESLKALLVSLWKQENEAFVRAEYVALSNAIQGYYQKLAQDAGVFPCLNTFYDYLRDEYVHILKEQKVKDRDFDVDNFMYVLRPYYRGGEFDFLLNATENLDILHQRMVIFEIDALKDSPILFPVATLMIMDLFISKMRKIKGVIKFLGIEEAWKAIAKAGMADFIKYVFKTVRKFYGIAAVVTQEVDDLISSPIIKEAIINNADIKILMDMRKFMNKFDALQATLGLSDKGKTMLLSVNKANEPGRTYREVYIDLGGQKIMVVRNELSLQEYYAYTTEEKEKMKVMEYAEKFGSMEEGIDQLVKEKKKIA